VKSVPSGEGAGGLIRLFGLHTGEGGEVLEIERSHLQTVRRRSGRNQAIQETGSLTQMKTPVQVERRLGGGLIQPHRGVQRQFSFDGALFSLVPATRQ